MTPFVYGLSMLMMVAGWVLCLISVALSFTLFKGIGGEDGFYQAVFAGSAIALETIKFALAPLALYYYTKGDRPKAAGLVVGFVVLMTLSIIASIGGLNKSTEDGEREYRAAIEKREQIKEQIARLDNQIESRERSIVRYQELDLHSLKATPLIESNEKDTQKAEILREELATIVLPERSMMVEGIESIALAFSLNPEAARAWIYVVISVLLDVFGALSLVMGESFILSRRKLLEEKEEISYQRSLDEQERARQHELDLERIRITQSLMDKKEGRAATQEPQEPTPKIGSKKPQARPSLVPVQTEESINQDLLRKVKAQIDEGILPESPSARDIARTLNANRDDAKQIADFIKKAG